LHIVDIHRKASVVSVAGLDTLRKDLEANNDLLACLAVFSRGLVVSNDQCDMIIEEILRLCARRREVLLAELKSSSVVFARLVSSDEARCTGEVIHNPLRHVAVPNDLLGPFQSIAIDFVAAEVSGLLVGAHG
jgi:hypothetical protein